MEFRSFRVHIRKLEWGFTLACLLASTGRAEECNGGKKETRKEVTAGGQGKQVRQEEKMACRLSHLPPSFLLEPARKFSRT